MTANARNVYAAEPMATGGVVVFKLGTAPPAEPNDPEGATAELPEGGVDLGHVGEDGVTETTSRNVDRKRNWGGKVVKVIQSEYDQQYKFTLLESVSPAVLQAVYGTDNVDFTAADGIHGTLSIVRMNAKKRKRLTWCIDSWDSELDALMRIWIPQGQLTEMDDVTIVHSDVVGYSVTLDAFPDENDNHAYKWFSDGNPEGETIVDLGA